MNTKPHRPAFQSVELDPIDQRLEAKAVEKGIPTLVVRKPEAEAKASPQAEVQSASNAPKKASRAGGVAATPRERMKPLNVEVPDYTWISIKMRAAQEMSSVRHVIMMALKKDGIEIREIDIIEDGRRLRGPDAL